MPLKVAILGLGEAGSHFANDLVAKGVQVSGWDPNLVRELDSHVVFSESNPAAVETADIVFSTNWSRVSEEVAAEVGYSLRDDAIYCEMNTSSPDMKRRIGEIIGRERMVDLAIMNYVPPKGILTPMLAAGPRAKELTALMQGIMDIEYLNENIGGAAEGKLLRSIVYKGIAGVICEAMEAGEKFELEGYMRLQIKSIIGESDELIDRFLEGTKKHARRRKDEMEAVVEMLKSKGSSSYMSAGAVENLKRYIE